VLCGDSSAMWRTGSSSRRKRNELKPKFTNSATSLAQLH
jgi:hypothetical protein